ncbi:PPE family protein [Mycobacterium stomatepiae]|uniref:Putative PPE family protein PPE49 n=1 Tax=Mycobacterium stomatepiae TaxID=470076 RepID=A0A7I7Q5A7_9MYCO|nr:PPE family protein [Mycobacterium stomatepiae]MCV7163232.1 PPE family protein [Mycobacterium stomatepiae]BBY21237.1 putative PPE family protein PPE49 [Mycobacterium stomatepiae]
MLLDYGLLPPEINSARMYGGPRSGAMWAAAEVWDTVAAELGYTASAFDSTVSSLTGGPWRGPASKAMATAAAPYVQWLTATSANAERVAIQTRLSAGAFEAAFAATVPPEVVVANRTLLMTLIATNILGQNTAAIAATEAEYAEMWAQDVAAMVGYDASTTAAGAGQTPFSAPPLTLTSLPTARFVPLGEQLLESMMQTLTGHLTDPMTQLQMLSTPAQFAMEPMNNLIGQAMSGSNSLPSTAGGVSAAHPLLASAVSPETSRVVSASTGRAASIGPLSVPASWVNATSAAPAIPAMAEGSTATVSPISASAATTPPSINMPARLAGAAAAAAARKGSDIAPGAGLAVRRSR